MIECDRELETINYAYAYKDTLGIIKDTILQMLSTSPENQIKCWEKHYSKHIKEAPHVNLSCANRASRCDPKESHSSTCNLTVFGLASISWSHKSNNNGIIFKYKDKKKFKLWIFEEGSCLNIHDRFFCGWGSRCWIVRVDIIVRMEPLFSVLNTVESGYKRHRGNRYFDSYIQCDSCNQFMVRAPFYRWLTKKHWWGCLRNPPLCSEGI